VWRTSCATACVLQQKKDWPKITKGLRAVSTAPTLGAAETSFAAFAEEWRERYPAIPRLWEHSWAEHTAFFLISLSSFTRWSLPPTRSSPSTPGSVEQHDNGDTSQPNKQSSKSCTPQPRRNDQDVKTSQEKSPAGNTSSTSLPSTPQTDSLPTHKPNHAHTKMEGPRPERRDFQKQTRPRAFHHTRTRRRQKILATTKHASTKWAWPFSILIVNVLGSVTASQTLRTRPTPGMNVLSNPSPSHTHHQENPHNPTKKNQKTFPTTPLSPSPVKISKITTSEQQDLTNTLFPQPHPPLHIRKK